MHINNCNTGKVEIVELHHIKNIKVAITTISRKINRFKMFTIEKRRGERIMMNIKQGSYRGTRNVSKNHRN